jgi:hypothetical protein
MQVTRITVAIGIVLGWTSTGAADVVDHVPAHGLVVVARASARDEAWSLAQGTYAAPSLRPPELDAAAARVLCGGAPGADAPRVLAEIAAEVDAVRGEDPASRAVLTDIARRTHVRWVVVVHLDETRATARAFLAESGEFAAETYAPDDSPLHLWTGAVESLVRTFGAEGPPPQAVASEPRHASAPLLATHGAPALDVVPAKHRAFYESPWFWGALAGAAAFAGAIYLTHDNGAPTLHLQATIPQK